MESSACRGHLCWHSEGREDALSAEDRLQSIASQRVPLLPGWFCPLPVDIGTAGGSSGGSGEHWLAVCLFVCVCVWISRGERWREVKKNKERANKEQL